MIVDLPEPSELEKTSIRLLNIAWKEALSAIDTMSSNDVKNWDDDFSARRAYESAVQLELAGAVATIQQAQELAIKSQIARVSPYLLLVGDVRGWPNKSQGRPVSFSTFRTIDASDLLRVHAVVSEIQFDEKFRQLFEDTRRKRNRIVHLGGSGVTTTAKEVLLLVLMSFEYLFPNHSWVKVRHDFEHTASHTHIHGDEFAAMGLVDDFLLLMDCLEPRFLRKYFGFDKRQQSFACLACTTAEQRYVGSRNLLAQIRPLTKHESVLYCCTCGEEKIVSRRRCKSEACPSDVLYFDDEGNGTCLLCDADNTHGN